MFKEKTLECQKKEYLDLMSRLSTLTRELKGTRMYLTFFKEATLNGTYIKTESEWKKVRNNEYIFKLADLVSFIYTLNRIVVDTREETTLQLIGIQVEDTHIPLTGNVKLPSKGNILNYLNPLKQVIQILEQIID